ncbi:DNA alkylation repair protein [Candidatus Woesearchaeota archaeon CG10_big_fil_rev_8_21_14_0_10_45_16]|nr:MAG: DNA alkylation repair protein [Candidatus Woesearchaeota archaeon CG10_big_fil_rev_8_21_14_0_10_45_16]
MLPIESELQTAADPQKAPLFQRFFKTGKGQYGEGDIFLGLTVPEQRKIAKRYKDLPLEDVETLLRSKFHEHRLTALFILMFQYRNDKDKIIKVYLDNLKHVNNWDLVDSSAPGLLGDYLLDKDRELLYKLARSDDLWEKRIAVISTFAFIKNNDFDDTLKISEILLPDKHDLIHKAVGWMLREVGKRDQEVEEKFLRRYHKVMPRTMLRYAIEKFDEPKRKEYLKK